VLSLAKAIEVFIQMAELIEDKELREKVIALIRDTKLSNPKFKKYTREELEKVRTPFVVGNVAVEREIVVHTVAVVNMCLGLAAAIEQSYGIPVKRDILLAGAIVHDLMKAFEWKDGKHTGILLDHSVLGAAELYVRGFPEEVIHLVASHAGEKSTTPPRTLEALILHYADELASMIEFHLSPPVNLKKSKESKE